MYRRIPVLTARRPMMAVVAVLGAGIAMLAASPAAPARAAEARSAPAAPGVTRTVSITAHPATSGRITPFSNPLDITCNFEVTTPTVGGSGFLSSFVIAGSSVSCKYDIDGTNANVGQIVLSEVLRLNGSSMDQDFANPTGINLGDTVTSAMPCQHGTWTNSALAGVTFPAGYVPQSTSASASSTADVVNCPGDPPVCFVSCSGQASGGGAGTAAGTGPAVLAGSLPDRLASRRAAT